MIASEQIEKGVCRNHHLEKNQRNKKYCDNCEGFVREENKKCSCCCLEIKRKRNVKYTQVKKIMNKFLSVYTDYLEYYEKQLMKKEIPIVGQIKHGLIIYQVDFRFMVLFINAQEMNEEDRLKAYEQIRKNITEVKLSISWGRSKSFSLFIDS